jgi:Fe-S cluster assembly protein SufB
MSETQALESMIGEEYKYGFTTDIEYEDFPNGINEDVVRLISAKKNEPEWMTEFRLKAYRAWIEMEEPDWFNATYNKPKFDTAAVLFGSQEQAEIE